MHVTGVKGQFNDLSARTRNCLLHEKAIKGFVFPLVFLQISMNLLSKAYQISRSLIFKYEKSLSELSSVCEFW